MDKKKIGLICIVLIAIYCIIGIGLFYQPYSMLTDSGWDTNYGGSSDWGSSSFDWGSSSSDWGSSSSNWGSSSYDWESSSSRDYGYSRSRNSYGYSSKSSSSDDDVSYVSIWFIVFVLVALMIVEMSACVRKNKKKTIVNDGFYHSSIGDADVEIQKFFPGMTEEQLLNILYQKFVDIQIAWMNFDYKTLERLCSNELYSSYNSDLEVLKSNHGQNIMSDFQCVAYNINGITEENGIVIIKMFLHATFYDYVIDTNTNQIIRGTNTSVVHNQYHLNFVVKRGEDLTICPSCGAKINVGSSNCDYCHTLIINNYGDFVLSSKNRI